MIPFYQHGMTAGADGSLCVTGGGQSTFMSSSPLTSTRPTTAPVLLRNWPSARSGRSDDSGAVLGVLQERREAGRERASRHARDRSAAAVDCCLQAGVGEVEAVGQALEHGLLNRCSRIQVARRVGPEMEGRA